MPVEQIKEQHPHRGDWLREIVFGLNDGLVTTLVFIMAVSEVAPARLLLVVLGEVLAGGSRWRWEAIFRHGRPGRCLTSASPPSAMRLSMSRMRNEQNCAPSTRTRA